MAKGWINSNTFSATNVVATKEIFFQVEDANSNYNSYLVRNIASTGTLRMVFAIPADFTTLVSIEAIVAPTTGAAATNRNIDLSATYGAVGQSVTTHSQSNTTNVYNFSGSTDKWTAIDLSSVFTSLAAGDFCGILITQNSVGGTVRYLGIRMKYT